MVSCIFFRASLTLGFTSGSKICSENLMSGSWLRSIVLQRSQRVNFFVIRVIRPLFSEVSPQVAQRSLETVGDRTSVTFLNTSEYVLSSHSSPPLSTPLGSFYFWYSPTHPDAAARQRLDNSWPSIGNLRTRKNGEMRQLTQWPKLSGRRSLFIPWSIHLQI